MCFEPFLGQPDVIVAVQIAGFQAAVAWNVVPRRVT
jgi:hypothetical protein